MTAPLAGRTALVTGASMGIGLAIAEAYAMAGARLVLCARGQSALSQAEAQMLSVVGSKDALLVQPCDVTDDVQVAALVAASLARFGRIDILVNCAGVYGPKGRIEDLDWRDWCRAIEVNLMGSVLPCRAVLPHFRAQNYGKIVQLSGGGATSPLPNLSAYAASKAAIVRFVETLAHETLGTGIDVNAIAPGAVNTRLLDEVLEAGEAAVGEAFYRRSVRQKQEGGTPVEKGAGLAVFLASAASDGISGRLISALWDEWPDLASRRAQLESSDIYTLRRITPEDRGQKWTRS